MVISEPILGEVSHRWLLSFCRRISRKDGTFGGAVFTAMPISTVETLFASLDLGEHGQVGLWDKQTTLARYPDVVGQLPDTDADIPPLELRAFLLDGTKMAIYRAVAPSDHIHQRLCIRQVGDFPLWVIAGTASQDYLAPWWEDVQRMAAVALAFALITAGMSWQIFRLWRLSRIRIAEMLVREAGEQAKEAQALAHLGTWVRDRRSGRYIWSDEVFRIYGYPPQSFAPDAAFVQAATHPDDKPALRQMLEHPPKPMKTASCNIASFGRMGRCVGSMSRDGWNRTKRAGTIAWSALSATITENKETETLLAESHALHEAVIAGSHVAIAVFEKRRPVYPDQRGLCPTDRWNLGRPFEAEFPDHPVMAGLRPSARRA